ncbi:MAG: Smr/MutS family protein [Alloprevotella sp.]|nr:Smr/MutS family protein [Alloprevotella sp.]
MIYPEETFEKKIGFADIRTQLRGRCMSRLGTEWIDREVKFSTNYARIVEQLAQVQEFQRFEQEEDDVYEAQFFDVRESLLRIRPDRTHLEEQELFDLKRSLQTVCTLTSFFRKDNEETKTSPYPALRRMSEGVEGFPHIVKRIDEVLNRYGRVKDTASPELLSVRHNLEVTSRSISHNLRKIIAEAQQDGYIDRDVAPTMRDGRLVIPLAPALKRKIRGIVHDESASGRTVFIEPNAVVEANNRIRELKAAERREIARILTELTSEIRPHITPMLEALRYIGHIDYLRALVSFSEAHEAIVPQVVGEPKLDWGAATHPILQDSLRRHGREQVPLDITLKGKARILLISGPNAGGKSVCLKTVGLLQYMLQCGMPVPMHESSVMGIFRDIFLSIGDEQSIEDDLSTYSSHLLGLKKMMKSAGPQSLLLIDEFGGGTEPQIGGALAEAMLDKFVQCAAWGVITTHYQNLKLYAEKQATIVNGAMLYDRAQMQPLFLLRIGHPGSSFAIEIARKTGIPEDVIAYATRIVGKDYVMSDKYLQDIARDKMYWETKRQKIHSQEKQLEETLRDYERELEDINRQRKEVVAQAKQEAESIIRASNAKIENTIRAIKEAQAEKERTREARQELSEFTESVTAEEEEENDRIRRKLEKVKRRQQRNQERRAQRLQAKDQQTANSTAPLTKNSEEETITDAQRQLQTGSTVRLKGQTMVGSIESINGKVAKVLFGQIYTNVPLARLLPAEAPKQETINRVSTFVSRETRDAVYEKKLKFKPQIDLRGMRGDEALDTIQHFIDDAILLEQAQVRILHGTGTGALRQLTREYLRTVPGVRTYHDEHVQFGGAGITVVELE